MWWQQWTTCTGQIPTLEKYKGASRLRPSHTTGHTGPYHGGSIGVKLDEAFGNSRKAERIESSHCARRVGLEGDLDIRQNPVGEGPPPLRRNLRYATADAPPAPAAPFLEAVRSVCHCRQRYMRNGAGESTRPGDESTSWRFAKAEIAAPAQSYTSQRLHQS